jgi:antitoxin YefM
MDAVNYTTAHLNLEETMDQVCDDHNPVIITRNNNFEFKVKENG